MTDNAHKAVSEEPAPAQPESNESEEITLEQDDELIALDEDTNEVEIPPSDAEIAENEIEQETAENRNINAALTDLDSDLTHDAG